MARKNQNKPIVETDKPGGAVVAYWPSSKAAADHYCINQVNISYNINGITKQAKGHFFRFASAKEIAAYEESLKRIDAIKVAEQKLSEPIEIPNIPVETIPEVVNKEDLPAETPSRFEQMLQESKKKLYNNSN